MRLSAALSSIWWDLFTRCSLLLAWTIIVQPAGAANFSDGFRWSATAVDGPSLDQGDPTTLRWSIVPDGLSVESTSSNLVSYLDGLYGAGVGGSDLELRPWFATLNQQLKTIEQKTGLTFEYVADDGAAWSNNSSTGGHGDIRLAGKNLSAPGELGRAQFPGLGGDLLLDTANTSFANPTTLGAVFQHEVGHALGLLHVSVLGASVLMNTSTLPTQGPQFDDLYALTRLYGDPYESLGGNDTALAATDLGVLSAGGAVAVGANAADQFVLTSESDFATMDGDQDIDFYRIAIDEPGELTVSVSPRGPTYNFIPENGSTQTLVAISQSDLRFRVLASDGVTPIANVDLGGLGQSEAILQMDLPQSGDYYVEVRGDEDLNQFYQLDVSLQAAEFTPTPWVFHDRFDADTFDLNAAIDTPLRQAGGALDSPYEYSGGLTPAGAPSAQIEDGALLLQAVEGSPTADAAFVRGIRNFGPELVGEKWLLSFDLQVEASVVSDDAVFALVLGDEYPLGDLLAENTALTVQLAADGDYRVVEKGGNAAGEANRSGNQPGPDYRVQVLIDESFSTPRVSVALNGATVLSNEQVSLDSIERYFVLHAQTLTGLPIDAWVEAKVDSLSIVVLTDVIAGDYNLDGVVNLADYTVWRDQLGVQVLPGTMADGNHSGRVDAADYTVWKQNFGTTNLPANYATVVPEPPAFLLQTMGVLATLIGLRKRCRSRQWPRKTG